LVVTLGAIQQPLSGFLANARLTPQPEPFTELAFARPDQVVEMMQVHDAARSAAFVVTNREGTSLRYRWSVTATAPRGTAKTVRTGEINVGAGESAVVRPSLRWADIAPGTRIEITLADHDQKISFTMAGARS
jgi:hypothetical protein